MFIFTKLFKQSDSIILRPANTTVGSKNVTYKRHINLFAGQTLTVGEQVQLKGGDCKQDLHLPSTVMKGLVLEFKPRLG